MLTLCVSLSAREEKGKDGKAGGLYSALNEPKAGQNKAGDPVATGRAPRTRTPEFRGLPCHSRPELWPPYAFIDLKAWEKGVTLSK